MIRIEDSSENRENWMKLYDRVLYDYKDNIQQANHGSKAKYEGFVHTVSDLRRRHLNPILNILLDAVALQLCDLHDELDAFKRGMTTGLTTAAAVDTGVVNKNLFLKSHEDEDDGESTTDDEAAFFKPSSPSLFDLKSLRRSSGKTIKAKPSSSNIKLSCISSENAILASTQKHVSDKPTNPPLLTNLNISPIKCPGTPELIVIGSGGNSENLLESAKLKESLPMNSVKHDPPRLPSRGPEVQNNRHLNESVASLESFDSTLPITDKSKISKPFEITIRSSNSNAMKKKKEPWYDFDRASSKKPQPTSKKSNSSNGGGKLMRQMKLDSLTRKKVPEKTVDLSTLKEYKGGAMLSQSGNGGREQSSSIAPLKRKSDESIESSDKREKLEPLERKSFSQTLFGSISPIKLNVVCQETNVTPPVSPRPGPSNAASGANKHETPKKINIPLRPASSSPENVEKQKKVDKGKQKPKEMDEISDFTYNLLKDFDKIPSREPPSPKFRYKEPVVRKKSERAKLRGWDCEECREYYEALQSQMDEKEIQRLKDKCSRHRYKYQPVSNTPENFWCTYLPSTEELYADGYIKVGTPVTINPKYIRPKRTSSDSEAENEES